MVDAEPSAITADHRQDHRTAAEERVERARRRVDRVARADGSDYDCGDPARGGDGSGDVLDPITVHLNADTTGPNMPSPQSPVPSPYPCLRPARPQSPVPDR